MLCVHFFTVYVPLIESQRVVADEQRCVKGLSQDGIDGNHNQKDRQLQNWIQSEKNRTGHHRQHSGKHEILSTNSQMTSPLTPIAPCTLNQLITNSLNKCWNSVRPFNRLRLARRSCGCVCVCLCGRRRMKRPLGRSRYLGLRLMH